ncbi:ArnT family glycosyltransferase [Legionella birminghamensis]|nr:glycosyltransferase family 39 protein [Legionella birminghamensis]
MNQPSHPRETRPAAIAAIFGFCLLIIFVRLFLRGSLLEIDEAEQIVLAQHFSWGYLNQPPLYNWLQCAVFCLLGANVSSLIALKACLLFACLFYYYQICKIHCHDSLIASCAMLSWAFIPAIGLDLLKDNTHSVLALLMACITWYFIFKPRSLFSFRDYCVLGLIIGCGLLSKYNYLLFLFPLCLTLFSFQETRYRIKPFYLLLSFTIGLIIASPYLLWLKHYAAIGLHASYKLVPQHKSITQGLLQLIKGILLFILPVTLLSQIFFPNHFSFKPKRLISRILNVYLVYAVSSLIILVLVCGIKDFETRWLIPILFIIPLVFLSQVKEINFNPRRFYVYIGCCLFLQSFFLSALVYRAHFGNQRNMHFPFTELTDALSHTEIPFNYILSDSFWLLGNLHAKTHTEFRFIDTLTPFNYPKGHLFLTWMGADTPPWVSVLFPNQKVITHPVYSTATQKVIGGWAEYNGPLPFIAHHSATIKNSQASLALVQT